MPVELPSADVLHAIVIGFLILAVLVLLLNRLRLGSFNDSLVRIETRVEDQNTHLDTRVRDLEDLIHGLDRRLHELQSANQQTLERRFGEMQGQHFEAANQLSARLVERFEALQRENSSQLAESRTQSVRSLAELREQLKSLLAEQQTRFEQRQGEAILALQATLNSGMQSVRTQVAEALARSSEELGRRVDSLTKTTEQRLQDISGLVQTRLTEGFEKTTATFTDVVKRLALIDEAQKKITELSKNVVNLQEILADKRSRGAFGEVQLSALVGNVMPPSSFKLQHTLSNARVADCVLFLPEPTGAVAIDAKFPLESYRRMTDFDLGDIERKNAERQFKIDIRKHIGHISTRYILPGETSDGAVMFIPAEAVFAEIQAHHPDLVQEAERARVWMVSPTTLMAILNTARAVLKDEATRGQVHIIQAHLAELAKDFDRFKTRMDALARHIGQASRDVEAVHVSATKISDRFVRIERVELEGEPPAAVEHQTDVESGDGS